MVEGIEGVGEAVVGGMAARALEPQAGEGGASGGACLNCGTGLIGDYCHRCGQSGHVHRTLRAFGHDIAHSALHFDGKVWRTLPLLAWKPGELTRRYIAGERARFVSPMALFLFSVFLMFAVFSTLGGPLAFGTDSTAAAETAKELKAERDIIRKKIADRQAERARLIAAGKPTAAVDESIASLQSELTVLMGVGAVAGGGPGESTADRFVKPFETAPTPGDQDLQAEGFQTDSPRLDEALKGAQANPSLFFYKVQTNAYKFSWALIPISAPFLWLLLFWKRRFKLYDHTVFVTYSIAFMSLAIIALTFLRPLGLGEGLIILAMMIIPPIHMYRQLKVAYSLSRFGALWRTVLLINFAFVAGTFFFVLLVTLGALG